MGGGRASSGICFFNGVIGMGVLLYMLGLSYRNVECFLRAFQWKGSKSAIEHWITIRPTNAKSDHLFITKNGRPLLIRNIRTSIDRYFKLAGIEKTTVNDLRHTWIAHHLAHGVSLVTISKIAGHKRLSTTGKYLQFVKNQLQTNKVQLEEL